MDGYNMAQCTAFEGDRRVASGDLVEVVRKVKARIDQVKHASVLIFDDGTSELIEVDWRGTMEDVLKRLEKPVVESVAAPSESDPSMPRGRGRPKLGVVAREVTLLPRHWDWLNSQPGGASVALRKLVEEARRVNRNRDLIRRAQEAANRFMSVMAGDRPGFEEATRALFAGNPERFDALVTAWPPDIRDHARRLAEPVFREVLHGPTE